jgi:hypothetical protein
MTYKIKQLLLAILVVIVGGACSHDDVVEEEPQRPTNNHTVIMYFPWSTNLYHAFQNNIKDMESAIRTYGGIDNKRLMVFVAQDVNAGCLYEIRLDNQQCVHDTLRRYTSLDFTSSQTMTRILTDVKELVPPVTKRYSLLVGAHGMGWIPGAAWADFDIRRKKAFGVGVGNGFPEPITRFIGGLTRDVQMDIEQLADGIGNAGITFDYILFDDCYMANVETAYMLRNVTRYLVGSVGEMMAYGMPYQLIYPYLISDQLEADAVTSSFLSFYSSYYMPYGEVSVLDCSATADMAAIFRQLREHYPGQPDPAEVFSFDMYDQNVFFDLCDYYEHFDTEGIARGAFEACINRLVVSKAATKRLYTSYTSQSFPLETCCGVSTSGPTIAPSIAAAYKNTSWYLCSD